MIKKLVIVLLFMSAPAYAAEERLTGAHVPRAERAHRLLAEVDARPIREIIDELNRTPFPEGNLRIYEAVAATYHELAGRKELTHLDEKKSLYDSIRMNVAFLQFGGSIGHTGDKKLHQWIRQTLQRHLPKELMDNGKLFYSLE